MDEEEAITRWKDFLPKIREKSQSLMNDAVQGCAALLQANDLDTIAMSNAWTAIECNLKDLSAKVESVWDDIVWPCLEDEHGWEKDELLALWESGKQLNLWIEIETIRLENEIFSDAANKILTAATAILEKEHSCSQCAAPLELDNKFFRSRHVPCPYCRKINTFEPGSKIKSVEYFCVNNIAKKKAIDIWIEYAQKDTQMRGENYETLETMLATERLLYEFTDIYLKERINIVPDYKDDYQRDLVGRMRMFYEEVETSPYWHNKRIVNDHSCES